MAGGWIKLHRQLRKNELWNAERFSRGQAWVDLLLMANYEPATIFIRGCEVRVERGQLAWSQVHLASRWKWNERTVCKFLLWLEKRQMIQNRKSNVTTIITVINYDLYQKSTGPNEEQNTLQYTAQSKSRVQTEKKLKKFKDKSKRKKNESHVSSLAETRVKDNHDRKYDRHSKALVLPG